ncbi:extracellular solute-binding protein, partial [Paenibacillus sp. LMG 31458]
MKRKLISVFALATTLTVIATGCGTKTEGSPTPAASEKAPASTTAAKKDVTLTVGASQNWIKDIDRKLAEAFTKETGIKIDFQVNPDDQYMNIVKTKLSTHEAPDVIYMSSGIGMDNFQPDKNFLDLSNEPWAANLKGWAKSGASINGKLYGFNTWSVDGWGVLYNTDLFAKYSLTPPKTYAEFAALCDKLLANGITPIYENGKDEWHLPLWLSGVSTVAGTGADLTAKLNKNEAKFADQAVLETAMTQLNEMNKKGYFGKNVLSNDWDHGYEAIGTGKYAMNLVYTTYQQEVITKFPNSGADKWKMFPIPLGDNQGFATSSGGIVRVVNKESKNI